MQMCIHYIAHECYNAYIRVHSYMAISTNAYLYNLYVYICLHAAIYQVIYIQTHYLRRVCVGGEYLPICTGVQPVSPFKAFKQC